MRLSGRWLFVRNPGALGVRRRRVSSDAPPPGTPPGDLAGALSGSAAAGRAAGLATAIEQAEAEL